MQIDMHFNATFCMAYAAGFTLEHAQQIATAAQFVDDNNSDGRKEVEFNDGSAVYLTATAHHPANLRNLNDEDQRTVWVPFHFVPGNVGDTYMERLVTVKDSPIARDIVANAIKENTKSYSLQMLGLVTHCYMDTFSHFGFSGITSPLNMVQFDTIEKHDLSSSAQAIVQKEEEAFMREQGDEVHQRSHRFLDILKNNLQSSVANLAALGHGAVLTYPDLPYLSWEFRYDHERTSSVDSDGVTSTRCNPDIYHEALGKLYQLFADYIDNMKDYPVRQGVVKFEDFSDKVKALLLFPGEIDDRRQQWIEAYNAGHFGEPVQPFPQYMGQFWFDALDHANGQDTAEQFLKTDVFKFYQAAEQHRAFVLRELLPSYGIAVK